MGLLRPFSRAQIRKALYHYTVKEKAFFSPKTVGRGVNVGWASFAHGYDQKAVAACMQGGGA